ncbi:DUF5995 family protein [Streptomyces sp. ITFR-16]|uniref:DUF5995 family protein n=1 Tax=Streptomyces sp. ITFR-16 TaxID=3075198 RepID=UPI00288A548E|nr:DUF5995 family protein [Streptomyces sp. ITFR-16]WNI25909.1 DUF5995 family protein [Streptomyces sp. ITFR-16]
MAQFEQLEHGTGRPAAVAGPAGAGTVAARLRASGPPGDGSGDGSGDGIEVFHQMYLAAAEEVAGPGAGAAPGREPIGPLAVRLVERYLAAVEAAAAGRRAPDCWRPLLQYRRHPGVRPVQFALAGLNAHTGHDLALAVIDTCRTLRCAPADLEEEFERAGDLLLRIEERIDDELMPGPETLEVGDPLLHLLGSWNPERAREAAWSSVLVLWRLRDVPTLAEEFRRRTDAGAGLVGRCLLTPCG